MTEEEDVPPAVTCPLCGRGECAGCSPTAAAAGERMPCLPWESRTGTWFDRLFRTAISSSTEPEQTFGELSDGRLGPPLAFAALAETLAIGSLAGSAVLALVLAAPDVALRALADPSVLWLLVWTAGMAVVLMVVLHAVWGFCLELGARGTDRGPRFTHGLRFGLYACGWDLLTSPVGILHGLLARGPIGAWPPILRAIQAPRIAMRAYLVRCRRFDGASQRRGKRLTAVVLGTAFFGIAGAFAALSFALLPR